MAAQFENIRMFSTLLRLLGKSNLRTEYNWIQYRMEIGRRIIWRKGGLRSSSGPWNPKEGRTGFVRVGSTLTYVRRIEEPNTLSYVIRKLLSMGYICIVYPYEDHFTNHDLIMDAIVEVGERMALVPIMFTKSHDVPTRWMRLHPQGRLSPKEQWVESWNCDDLTTPALLDD